MANNSKKNIRILKTITKKLKNDLDVNVIKSKIINEIVKIYDPDRCFFRVYDNEKKILFSIDNEYLSDREDRSLIFYSYSYSVNEYKVLAYSENRTFIVEDVELFIKNNEFSNLPRIKQIIKLFKEQNLKSFYGFGLYEDDKFVGLLELQYTKKKVILSEKKINFIKELVKQSNIALNKAEYFEAQKYYARKEKFLRETVEESILIDEEAELFNYVFKKIVKMFNIDSVIYIEAPLEDNQMPRIKYEYQEDKSYPSMLFASLPEECILTYTRLIETQFPVIVNNTKNFYVENSNIQCFYAEYSIEAFMTTPVITETFPYISIGGVIIMSHTKRIWQKNEVDLMRAVDDFIMRKLTLIKKSKEVEELRGSILNSMINDMQVPLVGNIKVLEFLVNRPKNTELRVVIPLIEELELNIKTQYSTLLKYIDIYKYESRQRKLFLRDTNLSSLIMDVIKTLNPLIASKEIETEVNINENLPLINLDKQEITKVTYSLLNNAVKHSNINSKVLITAREYNNKIVICIQDYGDGIPKDLEENLFNLFKAIKKLERNIGEGLNLYLCKLIVEAHGGKIWHIVTEEKGATFCFSLPK